MHWRFAISLNVLQLKRRSRALKAIEAGSIFGRRWFGLASVEVDVLRSMHQASDEIYHLGLAVHTYLFLLYEVSKWLPDIPIVSPMMQCDHIVPE